MAFTRVEDGDIGDDGQLNQLIKAWEGDSGEGEAFDCTEVDDASKYAGDFCNQDSDNGLQLRVRDSSQGTVLLEITDDAIAFGDDVTMAAGKTVDGLDAGSHNHTGGTNGVAIQAGAYAPGSIDSDDIANRSRYFFVPAMAGNATFQTVTGVRLGTVEDEYGYGSFVCPADYSSGMTVASIFNSIGVDADHKAFFVHTAYWAGVNEVYDTASDIDSSLHTYTQANGAWEVVYTHTLTGIAAGDFVALSCHRDVSQPTDPLVDAANLLGWLVSYTADS